ncbi:MAG: cytochrome d ubiquinol oxidase subunit II [Psychromonas sp.]|nr:cytochrome d ubiquinol oxidase subunit II [Psychromonas sp.]
MFDYETFKVLWWLIISILLIGFVITEGFDMGVGTLLPFMGKTDDERRILINTIAPHWEGNQVWFVLAAGAIFAAWPSVYATAFSGFYIAMMITLMALFFRPVGFDYRSKIQDKRWRSGWDWGIFIGSTVPPIIFGVAFGNLLQGVPYVLDNFLRSTYVGTFFGLLNPFALLVGVFSLSLFVLQGTTWLQMKTENELRARARLISLICAPLTLVLFALAGLWVYWGINGYVITALPDLNGPSNPLLKTAVVQHGAWFLNYEKYPLTQIAPVAGLVLPVGVWIASKFNRSGFAFIASSLTQVAVLLTFAFSTFPFIMASSINPNMSFTVWDSVSSDLTLKVMTVATIIFLPLILIYTSWGYFKMHGRIGKDFMAKNKHSAY